MSIFYDDIHVVTFGSYSHVFPVLGCNYNLWVCSFLGDDGVRAFLPLLTRFFQGKIAPGSGDG